MLGRIHTREISDLNGGREIRSTQDESLLSLIRGLPSEFKSFLRQEVDLAKTEVKENVARLKVGMTYLAAGGVAALFAGLLLLFSVAMFISAGLEALGLSPLVAEAIGILIVALGVGAGGFFLIKRAMKSLVNVSLSPSKAMGTMKNEEVGTASSAETAAEAEPPISSDEIKVNVEQRQSELQERVAEIKHRLNPRYVVGTAIPKQVKGHPVLSTIVGAGTGILGFLFWKSKKRAF